MPKLAYGARWHHERIDGHGYPDGLKGDEIPEEARIIAVADAYDAMTSNRSYRGIMPQEAVRAQIEGGKGTQFDPAIADVMIAMIDEDTDYTMCECKAENAGLREQFEEETILHMDGHTKLPEEIAQIQELDTDLGVYLCGDFEDYMEAIAIFTGSVQVKADKIARAVSERDGETYTTLVHSLKSSSRTVGATKLSDIAKHLEAAGKKEDWDRICEDTPYLLEEYRRLGNDLKKARRGIEIGSM